MDKDIELYSDPNAVVKKAQKLLGRNTQVYISTRKNKKYMLIDPATNKYVHFGQMGYEDYTKHNDESRRNNFLKRNMRWSSAYKYSPAYLSYVLLW